MADDDQDESQSSSSSQKPTMFQAVVLLLAALSTDLIDDAAGGVPIVGWAFDISSSLWAFKKLKTWTGRVLFIIFLILGEIPGLDWVPWNFVGACVALAFMYLGVPVETPSTTGKKRAIGPKKQLLLKRIGSLSDRVGNNRVLARGENQNQEQPVLQTAGESPGGGFESPEPPPLQPAFSGGYQPAAAPQIGGLGGFEEQSTAPREKQISLSGAPSEQPGVLRPGELSSFGLEGLFGMPTPDYIEHPMSEGRFARPEGEEEQQQEGFARFLTRTPAAGQTPAASAQPEEAGSSEGYAGEFSTLGVTAETKPMTLAEEAEISRGGVTGNYSPETLQRIQEETEARRLQMLDELAKRGIHISSTSSWSDIEQILQSMGQEAVYDSLGEPSWRSSAMAQPRLVSSEEELKHVAPAAVVAAPTEEEETPESQEAEATEEQPTTEAQAAPTAEVLGTPATAPAAVTPTAPAPQVEATPEPEEEIEEEAAPRPSMTWELGEKRKEEEKQKQAAAQAAPGEKEKASQAATPTKKPGEAPKPQKEKVVIASPLEDLSKDLFTPEILSQVPSFEGSATPTISPTSAPKKMRGPAAVPEQSNYFDASGAKALREQLKAEDEGADEPPKPNKNRQFMRWAETDQSKTSGKNDKTKKDEPDADDKLFTVDMSENGDQINLGS